MTLRRAFRQIATYVLNRGLPGVTHRAQFVDTGSPANHVARSEVRSHPTGDRMHERACSPAFSIHVQCR